MNGTPANSCLYGHPLLWRKTTNILQLQTWLHIRRHAPSNCTFQSQHYHSCSRWPQEKATITLKLLSTAVLAQMDPQIGSQDWNKEIRKEQEGCEFWLCRRSNISRLRKSHPGWFVCIHQVLLPFLREFVEYLHFAFIGAGRNGTLCSSFLRNTEFVLILALCPPKAEMEGVWNWSLKSPYLSFCFTCTQQHLVCTTVL